MANYATTEGTVPLSDPKSKETRKKLWRVFWILFAVTAFEFLIAFTVPAGGFFGMLKVGVFIILTIVKAFYIVAEFMHLGHEVKFLAYAIILPMMFVVWLLIALIYEGGSIFDMETSVPRSKVESTK